MNGEENQNRNQKRNLLQQKWLIVIAAAVLIVAAILITAGLLLGRRTDRVEPLINQLKDGQVATVYDQFSEALREQQSADNFAAVVAGLNLDGSCSYQTTSRAVGSEQVETVDGKINCGERSFRTVFKLNQIHHIVSYSIAQEAK